MIATGGAAWTGVPPEGRAGSRLTVKGGAPEHAEDVCCSEGSETETRDDDGLDGDKSIARSAALRAARRGGKTRSHLQSGNARRYWAPNHFEISCLPPTLPAHKKHSLRRSPKHRRCDFTAALQAPALQQPLAHAHAYPPCVCALVCAGERQTMAEFGDAGKTPVWPLQVWGASRYERGRRDT